MKDDDEIILSCPVLRAWARMDAVGEIAVLQAYLADAKARGVPGVAEEIERQLVMYRRILTSLKPAEPGPAQPDEQP